MPALLSFGFFLFAFALPANAKPNVAPLRDTRPVSSALASTIKLRKTVDGILSSRAAKAVKASVLAVSMDRNEVILDKNADELMVPASVNKVFTAYAALKKLKPTAVFRTSLYASGPVHDGHLVGDLYIKGGGDPSLVSERMWMLVNDFLRTGIKKISGKIIADSAYFDKERTPETRPKYLKDQAYNAPIGALSFNFNTTTIYVRPGENVGQPPVVYTDPRNSYIEVVNQAKTRDPGTSNTVEVSRTGFVQGDIGDTILLRGNIPIGNKEMRFYRNIVNPGLYTAHMFKTFAEERGIKIDGVVDEGVTPTSARLLLDFDSLPIWQIVWGMNKFSNNFVADQLLKKVGAQIAGPPGTMQKGVSTLEDTLKEIGIPKDSYTILDGSGLTRSTRVTTRQIVRVLAAAYQDLSIAPEFVSSLGVAGEDGTLRNRFSDSNLEGLVRGKTGTLDGVSSLAGYCPSADGEPIAFAILLNDPSFKVGRMTGWVDQIVEAISKFSRK